MTGKWLTGQTLFGTFMPNNPVLIHSSVRHYGIPNGLEAIIQ